MSINPRSAAFIYEVTEKKLESDVLFTLHIRGVTWDYETISSLEKKPPPSEIVFNATPHRRSICLVYLPETHTLEWWSGDDSPNLKQFVQAILHCYNIYHIKTVREFYREIPSRHHIGKYTRLPTIKAKDII